MSQSEASPDASASRHAVCAISVWFEPGQSEAFRARVSAVGDDGGMHVLGVTTTRAQVSVLVTEWLDSLRGS